MAITTANSESIKEAAQKIQSSELVVFPTETVYGLGASALDGRAVTKIFEAKKRPQFNPLIVHVLDLKDAEKLAVFDDRSRAVAAQFWPGPLTLILEKQADCPVHDLVTAGLNTIAIRCPSHGIARALIKEAGVPIAAPSANTSGEPSATTPMHAAQSLDGRIDTILAAGGCEIGLESTVLDMSGDIPAILRPGAITAEDLEPVLGRVEYDFGHHEKPKSPGQLLKHYAPSIPLRLNAVDLEPGEALLGFGSIQFMGIKGGGSAKDLPESSYKSLSKSADLHEAASNLFAMLRELDKPDHNKAIAVMNIPDQGLGIAINERLRRAAQNS